jgi:hypothetical protein
MNLVGKIFIVLIFVMALVFMSFAMAVYATHKNWKDVVMNEQVSADKPLGLSQQLKNEKTRNDELNAQKEKLQQQYEAEKAAKTQAIAKLENELKTAKDELVAIEKVKAELDKASREAVAAMNSTQTNATTFQKERDGLRVDILQAQKDRDAHFKEVVRLTDEFNQAVNDKDQLRKRTEDLGKDMTKADEVLRKFGLDKNKDYSTVPPTVDGVILATPGTGLVEISIGSDDGLLKGHLLEVYRASGGQSTYVGRIEVVKTAPDKSVCRIDPKFQNSTMMKGDRVASKIE